MRTARATTLQARPSTVEALLNREEALAIQTITSSVQRLGDDLCVAIELHRPTLRHPLLALGIGAFVGFVACPLFLRALMGIRAATSSISHSAAWRPLILPALALASRVVRARR